MFYPACFLDLKCRFRLAVVNGRGCPRAGGTVTAHARVVQAYKGHRRCRQMRSDNEALYGAVGATDLSPLRPALNLVATDGGVRDFSKS